MKQVDFFSVPEKISVTDARSRTRKAFDRAKKFSGGSPGEDQETKLRSTLERPVFCPTNGGNLNQQDGFYTKSPAYAM